MTVVNLSRKSPSGSGPLIKLNYTRFPNYTRTEPQTSGSWLVNFTWLALVHCAGQAGPRLLGRTTVDNFHTVTQLPLCWFIVSCGCCNSKCGTGGSTGSQVGQAAKTSHLWNISGMILPYAGLTLHPA